MIRCFAVPLAEFNSYVFDVARFSAAETSSEGFNAFIHLRNDADRVAAALTLGEVAKPYRRSLLVCQNVDDGEVQERLQFIVEGLEIRTKPLRFLWVRGEPYKVAITRAFMPGNPVVDPRGVWERL